MPRTKHRTLYRSPDAVIGGVCAGIADYYDVDALVVRIMAVLLLLMTFGLATAVYLVMWAHVPMRQGADGPLEVDYEHAELSSYGTPDYLFMHAAEGGDEWVRLPIRGLSAGARAAIVVVFVLFTLGDMLLMGATVPYASWWQFWPVALLIVGIFFIAVPIRSRYEIVWRAGGVAASAASPCLLAMSLNLAAWESLPFALETLWPLLLVCVVLLISGIRRNLGILVMGSAFCFVLFWLLGSILCIMPGSLTTIPAVLAI